MFRRLAITPQRLNGPHPTTCILNRRAGSVHSGRPRFPPFGGSDYDHHHITTSIDNTGDHPQPGGQLSTARELPWGGNIHDPIRATEAADPRERNTGKGKPESELKAAARRRGLTLKELANLMGVSYRYLGQVANGQRPWSPMMRERAMAVLGEVPGQGVVYRQGGVVQGGESTYIRERAREQGLTLRQVADRTGLSYKYVTQVSRGQRNLSPAAQARMEAVLDAPGEDRIRPACPQWTPASCGSAWTPTAGPRTRRRVRAGISTGHLSQIMNGQRTPSGDVLRRLHEVLFAPSPAELVAPVELKVMAWKKGGRNGVVVKGAGGPRAGGKVKTGGPSASAGGCPGAPRWSLPTPPATTATAGSR